MVITLGGKRVRQAFLDHSLGLVIPFWPNYHESNCGGNREREGKAAFRNRLYRYWLPREFHSFAQFHSHFLAEWAARFPATGSASSAPNHFPNA